MVSTSGSVLIEERSASLEEGEKEEEVVEEKEEEEEEVVVVEEVEEEVVEVAKEEEEEEEGNEIIDMSHAFTVIVGGRDVQNERGEGRNRIISVAWSKRAFESDTPGGKFIHGPPVGENSPRETLPLVSLFTILLQFPRRYCHTPFPPAESAEVTANPISLPSASVARRDVRVVMCDPVIV